jgi:hypothetical protein
VPVARHVDPWRSTFPAGTRPPLRISYRIECPSASKTASTQTLGFPGRFANSQDFTSGTHPGQAGSGDLTVRAQIHATTVPDPPAGNWTLE